MLKASTNVDRKEGAMRLFRLVILFALLGVVLHPAPASATSEGAGKADLSLTVTDDPDPVVYRWNVTYTAKVRNLGPGAAERVKVHFDLGSDMNFVSGQISQGSWTYLGGRMTGTLGRIEPGRSATMTLVGTVYRMVRIRVGSSVSSSTDDPVAENNTETEVTSVIEGPPPPAPTPSGGVFTGGGGTAGSPSGAALVTVALLAAAALLGLRFRLARR
jgi:hypothetical protein